MHAIRKRSEFILRRQRTVLLHKRQLSAIGSCLEECVQEFPHKEALRSVEQDIRWSFKEFNSYVDELAHGFQDLQLDVNDSVSIWLPNNAENLVTLFAAAKAGLSLAIIDPFISSPQELEFILNDSQSKMLIFDPKVNGFDRHKLIRDMFPELETYTEKQEVFRPKRFRNLRSIVTTATEYEEGMIPFHTMMINAPEPHIMERAKRRIHAKTPYIVTYKRSEDQQPKRDLVLTQGEALERAQKLAASMDLSISDTIMMKGSDSAFSFTPIAAAIKRSFLVIPGSEETQDVMNRALKAEPCTVISENVASFQRVESAK